MFEIISVNYNTPDLIDKLLSSLNKYYGDSYPVRIIDGSDQVYYQKLLKETIKKYNNVTIDTIGYNIHHGNGLHYGLTTTKYDKVLCLDSDIVFLKENWIEHAYSLLNNQLLMVGYYCYVTNGGIDVKNENDKKKAIRYIHPSKCFVNVNKYKELFDAFKIRFINHGAPNISISKFLHENKLTDDYFLEIKDLAQWDYFEYISRGTVSRYGLNL